MSDTIKKEDVFKILNNIIEVINTNWDGDNVLIDIVDTIRQRVEEL